MGAEAEVMVQLQHTIPVLDVPSVVLIWMSNPQRQQFCNSLLAFAQKPSAFYGVFDGHGGLEAAAYVRKNVLRLFFRDTNFPETSEVDDAFLEGVESSLRKGFLLADLALADDCNVSSSSGTTALTALVLGRLLMVANAGDCRAVLCRNGDAIDMSQDHRPSYPSEKRRVEDLGGFIDDGYMNGILSVTRALGDWDMKLSRGSASPDCRARISTDCSDGGE
ncbi:hypothetical protein K7X08_010178 [Anisodus acutangulus]|uniref:protein-serine/threonine phosphatase n=1 Tax=Anisodus acutangulus TaxID=402998 RepID=A0A9Q1RU95_9SOLA|nr:hypothetical protein K7X08_010178 [Anisodus acutangulus]